jgi:transcriptional regulator with XRE-family HTH domain
MKESFIKAVANELKIIRIENNDLQEDLARKTGIATSTISRYETGINGMDINKLEELLKPYNINLYIFFNRVLAKTQRK